MTGASLPLVADVRAALAAAADPAKAAPMQAYMRSAMPFRGVPKPPACQRSGLSCRAYRSPTARLGRDGPRALGRAEFREERYAARLARTAATPRPGDRRAR